MKTISHEYKMALDKNDVAIAAYKTAAAKFKIGKNFDADSAEFQIAIDAYKIAMDEFDVAFAKEEEV
jgi:hypothetical protein